MQIFTFRLKVSVCQMKWLKLLDLMDSSGFMCPSAADASYCAGWDIFIHEIFIPTGWHTPVLFPLWHDAHHMAWDPTCLSWIQSSPALSKLATYESLTNIWSILGAHVSFSLIFVEVWQEHLFWSSLNINTPQVSRDRHGSNKVSIQL